MCREVRFFKWLNYAAAAFVLPTVFAVSGQVYGVSYYAMQGYSEQQCKTALLAFRGVKHPAVSVLWASFGRETACIERFLEMSSGRPASIEIHATNETCARAGRFCTELDRPKRFRRRAREIGDFIRSHDRPGVTWLVSTGLEDDFSRIEYRRRVEILKAEIPNALLVRSRNGHTRDYYGADCAEYHGMRGSCERDRAAGRCTIHNGDGWDLDFGDGRGLPVHTHISGLSASLSREKDCLDYSFVWWSGAQGLGADKAGFTVPYRRDFRVLPKDVFAVNKLLRRLQ